jgi:hypothetical protein
MDRLVPAVFLQKQLDNQKRPSVLQDSIKKPLVLELYEADLEKIVGGEKIVFGPNSTCTTRKTTGVTTYSGSQGWLDLQSADDCTISVTVNE